ncbi:TPM domain-containing protein [Lutibacter sp.]|uniref:TPM domain-containing protein n=1 Tax=Lutibacter sp. TaxID=1925666 RepID=UPI0025BB0592|nr:TPM domain-containing protein [Lutibacter sp.]MCF6168306.1 TPM domain-containing protein [Lutibacter sp.]
MPKVEDFLTKEQEQKLIQTIKVAEKNTSGEIRVHIEKTSDKPPMDRALEVFHFLKMNETELKNGVLLYVAIESKQFAIIGDEGIHNKVTDSFWDSTKEIVLSHFAKNEFAKGLELGILEVGEKLKNYFPYQSNDTNELSDEISKG